MTKRSPPPAAGGFFLILPILIGFVWGLIRGTAVAGVLLGLAVGIVMALAVYAWDRRRR